MLWQHAQQKHGEEGGLQEREASGYWLPLSPEVSIQYKPHSLLFLQPVPIPMTERHHPWWAGLPRQDNPHDACSEAHLPGHPRFCQLANINPWSCRYRWLWVIFLVRVKSNPPEEQTALLTRATSQVPKHKTLKNKSRKKNNFMIDRFFIEFIRTEMRQVNKIRNKNMLSKILNTDVRDGEPMCRRYWACVSEVLCTGAGGTESGVEGNFL